MGSTLKLSAFNINNFRGIEHASANSLDASSIVIITGHNGTGKSLVLQAIVAAWNRSLRAEHVGPFSDRATVTVEFLLSSDEMTSLTAWKDRTDPVRASASPAGLVKFDVGFSYGAMDHGTSDQLTEALFNKQFRRDNSFAVLDYLPANRTVSAAGQSIDVSLFTQERIASERQEGANVALNGSPSLSLPSIGNWLMTLDYQRYLRKDLDGDSLSAVDEYQVISDLLFDSTGKRLLRPEFEEASGQMRANILLPSGQKHPVDRLSSGELELLGLVYFVRRLSATGGILLVDEPEQHLHPSLQATTFATLTATANRGQIIGISHSANVIKSAVGARLLELKPPLEGLANQVSPVEGSAARSEVLSYLGLRPTDLIQAEFILVVEGISDRLVLSQVFPILTSRGLIVVAGSSKQVLQMRAALTSLPFNIPFLCVIDRDLRTDSELFAVRQSENLFVWGVREIEGTFLDGDLLSSVYHALGRDLSPSDAWQEILAAASPLRGDLVKEWALKDVYTKYPGAPAPTGNSPAELKVQLEGQAKVFTDRANAVYNTVSSIDGALHDGWPAQCISLGDSKVILKRVYASLKGFDSYQTLLQALIAKSVENDSLLPTELVWFRRAVDRLLVLPSAQ